MRWPPPPPAENRLTPAEQVAAGSGMVPKSTASAECGWTGRAPISWRTRGAGKLRPRHHEGGSPMADIPRLDQINLVVRDVASAVELYRLLGLEVDDPPAPCNEHHRT